MKKLLLFCLIVIACKAKNQQAITSPPEEKKRVDSLLVDQSILSETEKQYLKSIDSLQLIIDSKSHFVRSVNATTTQSNIESEIRLDGFSEKEGGEVNKIIASVKNEKQDISYYHYYLNGTVVKIASDVRDFPPFYSAIYFKGDTIYRPNDLSDRSAKAVKAQSAAFLLTHFQ